MKNKIIKNKIINIYTHLMQFTKSIVGIEYAKSLDSLIRFKRKMNIKHPKSLAEKIAWLEYHDHSDLRATCTDKWAVRDYIISKGLESILVPVFGNAYGSIDGFDLDALPNAFVIKATHGCKMNYICQDKTSVNLDELKQTLNTWLNTTFGLYSFEPHYLSIPHRFYVEKFLGDGDAIVDYKFFCMNGVPSFVEICSNRKSGLKLAIYDMNWNLVDAITSKRSNPKPMACPEHFQEMKSIAEKLSADFPFVRVDLYDIGGQIYFSELTFTPATCVLSNFKEDFLLREGAKLDILPLSPAP